MDNKIVDQIIDSNVTKMADKIVELESLRAMVHDRVSGSGKDARMGGMVYAETIKGLLEVDKTILSYYKEINSTLNKQKTDAGGGGNGTNPFLSMLEGMGMGTGGLPDEDSLPNEESEEDSPDEI